MDTATRLRRARVMAGLSQAGLAALAGTSQPNISAYERGRRRPDPATLQRLLAAAAARPSIVLAQHREAVLETATRRRATDVRVFGSIARGDDTPSSDIDLLVRFEPGASLLDHAGLVVELEDLLERHVDVVSEAALRADDGDVLADARPL